jgi:hypothetical protein
MRIGRRSREPLVRAERRDLPEVVPSADRIPAPSGGDLSEFLPWLELTREQVVELPTTNFTHFEDVLDVYANTIRLRPRPEELVFVSAKTMSTAAAPWLAV